MYRFHPFPISENGHSFHAMIEPESTMIAIDESENFYIDFTNNGQSLLVSDILKKFSDTSQILGLGIQLKS